MSEEGTVLPEWLKAGLTKPIAVFGQGMSGQASRDLLGSLGIACDLFDERHASESFRVFTPELAKAYSIAIPSPGFPYGHPWLEACRGEGVEIVPEMELGAAFWKGPIVAITGTNGKTTLTEFLTQAFGSAGMEAYACGNIGRPLSRLVVEGCNPEAIAVCEVSSFQAEISSRLPIDTLLWTNFDEDHLDRHESLEVYFDCKYKLFGQAESQRIFFDASVAESAKQFGKDLPESGLIDENADPVSLGIGGTIFDSPPELFTYLMARALWNDWGLSEDELVEAAHAFKKPPHRMELVSIRDGVSYWDDSKATNFHAVLGAFKRFENPVLWIGGGKNKGGDIERFAKRIAPQIVSAHLIGETAEEMKGVFAELGVETQVYSDLEGAVAGARLQAEPGSNILLSPGFASLDMFDGYTQRGEVFRRAINSLEVL